MMNRFEHRARYIAAWYELDGEQLVSSCAEDFIFEDPAEPFPINRGGLIDYMHRWDARVTAKHADPQWKLEHEVRQDQDGILTDWEWWEVLDTGMQGMAIVLTSDQGVFLERITYFDQK